MLPTRTFLYYYLTLELAGSTSNLILANPSRILDFLRNRGSDATRVNVTINGIPFNDAEGQGVFWVNMPDISSSTDAIQIQRGVGASATGASAFGASIN